MKVILYYGFCVEFCIGFVGMYKDYLNVFGCEERILVEDFICKIIWYMCLSISENYMM